MNHTYKTLYNTALGTWVAVPETARNYGKSKSVKVAAVTLAVAGALFSSPVQAAGLPWGSGANAPGNESIAMGNGSDAKTNYTIALGTNAKNTTNGEAGIIIGSGAKAITDVNPNTAVNTMGQQVVIGEASEANSQSVALGAQVYARGQSSIAIGGDDLGNNDSKTSAGKYGNWRDYAGQPITVEGVSTKDASNPAIGFTSTTASGRGSIAVGHMGQSTGKASVAIGADSHAEADGAIATGMASQAKGVASVATGIGATAGAKGAIAAGLKAAATGTDAVATGTGAKAGARNDVAIGHDAGAVSGAATTGERVMIGANATVGANQNINVAAGGTFGTINLTTKTANQSVAIGGGSGEGAGRRTYAYGDQSLAIGSDTLAYGDGSVAIGGDDLDSAGNQQTSYTDPNSGAQTTGTVRQAYNALTGDTMQSGVYAKTVSKQAAVAVGVQAQAADLGVALGAKSGATKTNSVAIGTGAQATLDNAVAIGGGSKTLEAGTKQESTTINGVTYNWAGGGKTLPGDIVSFGSSGYERQLKHVAAGEVSANSTDAINGSQLYAVAEKTQTHYYSVNDGGTRGGNYNNDGATGSNSLAAGVGAVASAKNTVAAGYNAQATHDGAVAVGANTSATNASTALGDSSKATGENSTALGWNANAAGRADVFIGKQAGKGADNTSNFSNIGIGEGAVRNAGSAAKDVNNIIGIGTGAAEGIQANHNIALGAHANGTGNVNAAGIAKAAVTTTNNVAIGERTYASGGNAIAIGNRTEATGLAAIAFGAGADAKGQNGFAAGQNTEASASGTVAIGGSANAGNGATASGVQAVAIGQLSKASGNKTTAVGAEANASGLNSTALGTGASTAGGLGGLNAVAVGAKATANAGSTTAVGAAAQASGINAAAFGAGAQAGTKGTAVGYNAVVTHNGAIALGADSVSTATFGAVPNATINGITYGNFAAANVNATVSVGSAGNERAITNVGAGRINATSTDAINGSQLYAITNQLQAGQTHYYSVNDGGTRGSNYNNDGARGKNSLAAGANARAGSSNSVAMGDGADTGNGVNSNIKGLNTAIGSNAKIGANGKISWEATAVGADTVAEGVRTTAVGYGASATEYYATALGYKSSAPEWHALAIGSQATVAPTASTDVAAAQAITTNLTNVSDASKSAAAVAIGRQATAGGYGAIAQGLNTQATTAYATAVGANAKASKVGSTAFGAYASAEADSSVALGRYSHADREKLAGTATLGADPLGVGAQAGSLTWQSNAGAVSVGSSSNRNYAGVNVPATTRQIINLAAGSADTDAVNVAQLKAAGFNLAISNDAGGAATDETPATATGADDKKIANGETFTLDAGSGISLKQKGGKITIATDAQAITDNAQLPVVYTKADGTKVYKRGNKFYDDPVGGNEVAPASIIASMQNAAGSTTAPTTLANVASNLKNVDGNTKENPMNNSRTDLLTNNPATNKGNNAATVKDVLNAGFNVQGNGEAKDFVTHGDTINFANGRGTTANVSSSNGTTTVKFDTPLEYVGASGAASTTPTNTVKLVGGNASKPVTLQNVAAGTKDTDAVNVSQLNQVNATANAGFKIAANSDASSITADNKTIKPNETLTIQGTGTGAFSDYDSSNIQTQVSGDGTVTIGLKKDLNVNSVTAGDSKIDDNGLTINGGPSVTKTGIDAGNKKITNVADGTIGAGSKDAINGGQLHNIVNNLNSNIAAAKTEVKSSDKTVTVTAGTNAATGATVYDLAVNTDGTTITKDANGKLKANTTTLNVPTTGSNAGKVTAPAPADTGKLVTAGDIASAINNSGFTLTTSASSGTVSGSSQQLINPGNTMTIDAGRNISILQSGRTVTVATKDQVEFTQVTVKDTAGNQTVTNPSGTTTSDAAGNKTVTNANGITITPANGGNAVSLTDNGLNNGGNKITNVAAGTEDSDAVNYKQLKAAKTEVKAGTNIASVDKTQANDGHDIYTVNAKGTTVSGAGDVIVTATDVGDNVTNYQVSLSGGVKQDIGKGVQAYDIVTTQGIRFGGDTGTTNTKKLGDTMMITGDENVKTSADANGIRMRLNPDVNVDSVTTGDTKMNDAGVTINNGPSMTKQGMNAGNLPIRNVAPGRIARGSTDAVNGDQLYTLGRYVDDVDKRAKAGTASAIATAGLPQAYRPGASMVAAAGGYYDGQSAIAIGVSTISDNGKWIIKGAANVNSKEAGATIGIGYQW